MASSVDVFQGLIASLLRGKIGSEGGRAGACMAALAVAVRNRGNWVATMIMRGGSQRAANNLSAAKLVRFSDLDTIMSGLLGPTRARW